MNPAVAIIGLGELGGVFARGFLRTGYPVYPITRKTRMSDAVQAVPEPKFVLVAVAEKDLANVLATLPSQWKNRVGLLQNELLPYQWLTHGIANPTVITVWFEKKKGRGCKVLLPSPIFGPEADLVSASLQSLDIPSRILPDANALLFELVLKNLFVLTINIAGLKTGGTVSNLWSEHNELARQVAGEVLDIQEWLTQTTFPREQLLNGLVKAINGDPAHTCKGRAAPDRLARVLRSADDAGLQLPAIRSIQQDLASD